MRLMPAMIWAAALTSIASGESSTVYRDAETGFTFSENSVSYVLGKSLTFRIALPNPTSASEPYNVVLQVVAPKDVGWAGLAWGGGMLNDPLTVVWANGNSVVLSSRYTSSRVVPQPYTGAAYQLFRTGTKQNGTHFQLTAKCTGCTTFNGRRLSTTGTNKLAFAYSAGRPSDPGSNSSSFPFHDSFNYWSHDFSTAGMSISAPLL
ncbi:CBD9-like protein [Coniochaeta ligniaria NRRL 30616]|uniref:CBD9-like protein n=1 Tax=Coniochaeta ligniaria NRRL 30616 TaxID=1408157 RepID=A0A1J7J746_9PEZI|nr:CBD9-like protein [Coniochaeta ligniaria NRRL 30616]